MKYIYTVLSGLKNILLILLFAFTRQGFTQIELVKDINPYVQFYNEYGSMAEVNGVLYFTADQALWKTDGTPSGAVKIKAFVWIGSMIDFHGTLLFSANDGKSGRELWKSDGTIRGTVLLKDANIGKRDSDPQAFTLVGNTLFFTASTENTGREIWSTNGTREGTNLINDLLPGPESSDPHNLMDYNGKLVFIANDGIVGAELHLVTLGKTSTVAVLDVVPGAEGSNPRSLAVFSSNLYFNANTLEFGDELWKTDGTPGNTTLVRDIWPGRQSSYPSFLISVGDALFFIADDGTNGSEYWKSNGTTLGTVLAFEVLSGPEPTFGDYPYDEEYGYNNFAEATANGRLYFGFRNELYENDGTSTGTRSLGRINAGYYYNSPRLFEVDGTIYVFAMDEGDCCNYGHVWHLAKVENSTLVTVTPLPRSDNTDIRIVDGSMGLFFAFADEERNYKLWVSNGTAGGTYPIHDWQKFTMSSTPRHMTAIDDYIIFDANDHIEFEVTRAWRSDGTPEGTYRIGEQPLPASVASKDNMGFMIDENRLSTEQVEAPVLIDHRSVLSFVKTQSRVPASVDSSNIHLLEYYKGAMYFSIVDPLKSYVELWRTDGTERGTVKIKVLTRDSGAGAQDGAVFNGILYFAGTPENIWRTDGTAKGTFELNYSGANAISAADEFAAAANTLFFRAAHPSFGVELFKLDAEDAPTSATSLQEAAHEGLLNGAGLQLLSYPNPFITATSFTMQSSADEPMEISLRSVDGMTMLEMKDLTTNRTYSVGQGLRNGMYLLYVNVGGKVFIRRIMKTSN